MIETNNDKYYSYIPDGGRPDHFGWGTHSRNGERLEDANHLSSKILCSLCEPTLPQANSPIEGFVQDVSPVNKSATMVQLPRICPRCIVQARDQRRCCQCGRSSPYLLAGYSSIKTRSGEICTLQEGYFCDRTKSVRVTLWEEQIAALKRIVNTEWRMSG